jgi:uncharacterized protein YjiS (DUF1127 family)
MRTELNYGTPNGGPGSSLGEHGGRLQDRPVAAPGLRRIGAGIAALLAIFGTWHERRRFRAELEELDEHLLDDIGLTPSQARSEAAKPFWRD